jgi:acetoin utilization deacetylase AcuC-like enzyme
MLFVVDPLFGEHLRGVAHPERPERVEQVEHILRARGVIRETLAARDATGEELLRVHTREYLDLVERETARASTPRYLSTGDTILGPHTYAAALRSAGAAVVAMEAAVEGNCATFSLARPPGHHAEPDRGMGFCLFNNVAVAARSFLARGHRRVLVVDFDYHHGNGTQAVAGSGLSYVSTHASPAYPGTGAKKEVVRIGDDVVANEPLPASGVTTRAFVETWNELLPRAANIARPEVLLVSAGFDYVAGDPVGDLGVGVEAATSVAECITAVAREQCNGRVAYVLEGGYLIDGIADSIERIAKRSS